MLRERLYADPEGLFLHDVILASCRRHGEKTAVVDTSSGRRISYAQYGETVEALARGFIAAGLQPGEVVAIFLSNSWEYCAAYHAATLAGGFPTLLNPTYREREVRYQLENSGAAFLVSDAPFLKDIKLDSLPALRRVYVTRSEIAGVQRAHRAAGGPKPQKSKRPTEGLYFRIWCRSSGRAYFAPIATRSQFMKR